MHCKTHSIFHIVVFLLCIIILTAPGHGIRNDDAVAYPQQDRIAAALPPGKDIRTSCLGCHETSYGLAGSELIEKGRIAFSTYACYGCHGARGFEELPKFAPPWEDLDEKIADVRWLTAWLRNPQAMRPETIMPDFKLTDAEISDISAFLLSLKSTREYPPVNLARSSPEKGKDLFTERGCKACHSDERLQPPHRRRVPNLSDTGLKLTPAWMSLKLEIPRELNPDSRMPRLDIDRADARDIIAYLSTLSSGREILQAESRHSAKGSVKAGKELVEQYGCYGCHRVPGFEKMVFSAPNLSALAEALSFGDARNPDSREELRKRIIGKIRAPRQHAGARMPRFTTNSDEREALAEFILGNYSFKLADEHMAPATQAQRIGQAGDWILTEYNCRACHMLNEGTPPHVARFIGLKTYLPPRLTGEGEKVQPEWLMHFLDRPFALRPWLRMRMPTFFLSTDRIGKLVEYFSIAAASPENARIPYAVPVRKEDVPPIELAMGEYRVRFDRCMQCHPISYEEPSTADGIEISDLSVNLMMAKHRLRFEWIKDFLKNPDRYAGPDTRMPFIYYSPEGTPRVPEADMWIDYVAKYLMVMESPPEPLHPQDAGPAESIDWPSFDY